MAADNVTGAGQAHRDEDSNYWSADFTRPQGHHDPTGVAQLRRIALGISDMPRADWRLYGPVRIQDDVERAIWLQLDSELMAEFLRFLGERAEIKPSRTGRNLRARLLHPRPANLTELNSAA